MYFHPPTFESGPVATAIGLALIVCLVAFPLAFRPLYVAVRGPLPSEGTSPLVRFYRALSWWALGSVLTAMLFAGTASAVAPADVGLSAPTLYGVGDNHFAGWFFTYVVVMLPVTIVLLAVRAWRRWRGRRSGNPVAVRQRRIDPRVNALLPRNPGERRTALVSGLVAVVGTVCTGYVVLIPLFMGGFGLSPWVVLALLALLDAWMALNTGWRNVLSAALVSAISAGCYLFVFAGCLLTPLLIWGLIVVLSRVSVPYRRPDSAPAEPAAAEPVMTWRPDDGAGTPEARP